MILILIISLIFAIDELLIDIYFYLDKSSKRLKTLKSLQIVCDTGVRKILKHGSTRWLSLGLCIDRLLSQWEPPETREVGQNCSKTKFINDDKAGCCPGEPKVI